MEKEIEKSKSVDLKPKIENTEEKTNKSNVTQAHASPSPPQQNEICAQFASQLAATLRHNSTKQQSSTPPTGTIIPADEQQEIFEPCVDDVGTIIPGGTSVDPLLTCKEKANEYNMNIVRPAQKVTPVHKTVIVSAGKPDPNPLPLKTPVSIKTPVPPLETPVCMTPHLPMKTPVTSKVNKTRSVSDMITSDVSQFKPVSFTANKVNQNTQTTSISVGLSPSKDTGSQPTSIPEVKSQKPVTVTASAPVQPSPVITALPVSTENKDVKSTHKNEKTSAPVKTPVALLVSTENKNLNSVPKNVKSSTSLKMSASVKAPLPVKSVPSPASAVPTVAEKEVEKSKSVDLKPKTEKTEGKVKKIKNGCESTNV
ncbi:uncharacterized protein LOC130013591 [Patella vulgata]|uniref:uncharacterized protein LOC130013591 n=1 Tax=Patella vulgata TaxID=6465 RepID=UPI0024A8CC2E|nr:uncharacterized protein LOC130013591 [Patella vulgata]